MLTAHEGSVTFINFHSNLCSTTTNRNKSFQSKCNMTDSEKQQKTKEFLFFYFLLWVCCCWLFPLTLNWLYCRKKNRRGETLIHCNNENTSKHSYICIDVLFTQSITSNNYNDKKKVLTAAIHYRTLTLTLRFTPSPLYTLLGVVIVVGGVSSLRDESLSQLWVCEHIACLGTNDFATILRCHR